MLAYSFSHLQQLQERLLRESAAVPVRFAQWGSGTLMRFHDAGI